ncbi:PREDICTED: glomulin isoform X3 [Hipposideros armiger]|uniref:Glomulin isoform X3 n=1 Tax=Hipposideros armiger TaxID=186990 RepID=A0A8B7Q1A0_HIPAR|nr:PREDICTED: glomulin isoform X3 [Hipposideros armiger]
MAVEELQSVINRCQILEEQDFKEEDFGLFQVAGQRCIDEGHIDQLLEIIQNEKNKVIIKHMGWNLVGPVVRCLLWNNKEDDKRKYFLMLDLLIKLCNPKELLLGLLELIEEPSGKQISQIILLLLQPLQTVIQKLHSNKAYSVGLALSTVWSQLCLLPVPYSEEQIQTDNYGLCQCCMALIEFTKPFVEEVIGDKENSLENEKLKDELLKFCFKSLKCPLLTAQFLEQSEEAGNDPLRCFASEIIEPLRPQISTLFPQPLMLLTSIPLAHSRQTVGILSAIGHPFPKMIFNHGRKKRTWDYLEFEEEEDKQLADSMASLAYLVFVQGISIDQLPMVLSPSYLLQFNMGHIEVFLQRTEESVFCKGLGLVKVMTLCPVETLRKKSLAMLQLYINKLDSQGKYTLFRCLLNTSNHSGVEAFIIQNIKNQIDISLKRTYNKWFTGPQLISLLDLVLFLPEGAETDLLQNSDRIMASLNLLRYLVIKDNENDNQTGIWTELGKIENNFLKPLHTGLNMSKAHYEAQIKNNQENSQEVQKSKDICSITVGGEDLPNMPPEMQLKVLHSALFTFDLIESVLARVEELIEIKRSTSEENTGIK